ncbi:histidinol-phosphate aminotransferase family protein [Nakamurella flava]|uniref:Aminotransferase n=1 Tax=Nakamurella flava TaxID=2576308 RepID=A0A4V6CS63_9ACTN|nr:histidinol-phosphate transaminase [Nakamurella flava]TKV60355.1 histidinol-phosphate aminotransferase family protein [Nakamurella flava]
MGPVTAPLRLALAGPAEREQIYRLRHAIYAVELGQHRPTPEGRLTDALDPTNDYLVALNGSTVVGFVSITPPSAGRWSLEKYLDRDRLPIRPGESVFEIRLLTVPGGARGGRMAAVLMAAALHRVRVAGGDRVIGMGRREVLGMYRRAGLRPVGLPVTSGAVHYEVMTASVAELVAAAAGHPGVTAALTAAVWDVAGVPAPTADWCSPEPSTATEPVGTDDGCFHGGAFFAAIGEDFADLDRRHGVVNADVLDAWFPPAPGVLDAVSAHLPWLLHTSPPTGASGLVAAVARAWSVPPAAVLPGAGSSALIYLAFGRWLTAASRVLLPDPSYGEYAHVLERVIGCQVDRYPLHRNDCYDLDAADFVRRAARYDLAVLVNPNSPTGRLVDTAELRTALAELPASTRIWIDETYLRYAQAADATPGLPVAHHLGSVAPFAAASSSVFVVTSLSKAYALSGARVAHLVGPPEAIAELRRWSPPWAVGLPTQVAAVRALEDPDYYQRRWQRTAVLRHRLADGLTALGLDVVPGVANFLLAHLPSSGPTAADLVSRAAAHRVFLRDVTSMGTVLGERAVRVAVKDEDGLARILSVVQTVFTDRETPARRR